MLYNLIDLFIFQVSSNKLYISAYNLHFTVFLKYIFLFFL